MRQATKRKPEIKDDVSFKDNALNAFFVWYKSVNRRSPGIHPSVNLNILLDMTREYCQLCDQELKREAWD